MEFKEEIADLKERLSRLEEMAHPRRAFVTCESCKKKIRETIDGTDTE